jgi:chaperonin GroES
MATATEIKVKPLSDRVVVKALEDTEQMRGGLYIPDTAKEKPQQGEVVAVGPGKVEDGKRVDMELKVGDRILYGKYSGTEVTVENEQYLILRESTCLPSWAEARAPHPLTDDTSNLHRGEPTWLPRS